MKQSPKQHLIDDIMERLDLDARNRGRIGLDDTEGIRLKLERYPIRKLKAHLAAQTGSTDRLVEVNV